MGRMLTIDRLKPAADHPALLAAKERFALVLAVLERRLGAVPYLAGAGLTAADIMSVFSLTTMRLFAPFDLAPCPAILAYLQRIGARPAYRRAMAKAEPGFTPLLGA
jgi:glutathione S-transferase